MSQQQQTHVHRTLPATSLPEFTPNQVSMTTLDAFLLARLHSSTGLAVRTLQEQDIPQPTTQRTMHATCAEQKPQGADAPCSLPTSIGPAGCCHMHAPMCPHNSCMLHGPMDSITQEAVNAIDATEAGGGVVGVRPTKGPHTAGWPRWDGSDSLCFGSTQHHLEPGPPAPGPMLPRPQCQQGESLPSASVKNKTTCDSTHAAGTPLL